VTRRLLFFILTVSLAGAVAYANPEDKGYTRLARLSYLEGNVSFQHASDVDWSSASINLPLEPGDRIYTGPEGRAEIQFDDGSAIRLAENTDIEILSLRQELIQIRMMIGLSTLTVRGDADFEINTPAAAFNAVRDGVYRFDVIENGDTDAIVRKGELEAANNDFARRILPGELMHLSPEHKGSPEVSQYDRRDEWDEWTDRRNADLRVYGNVRYLPDNVNIGASDLDRYGRWVNVESYGTVWVPYDMVDDWAPYSYGRWCYRPFYGWTWVSYEPWGWLPYHYGSWYRSSMYGWCWIPGPAFSFNFWSPGLVTFYSGPGWISWCPLGPGDYYDVQHYHYNHGIYSHQLASLQRLHSRSQGDLFNREVHGAFRTARTEQFRDGSFDRNRSSRWGNVDRPWTQGNLVRDRLSIQPTSKSFSAIPDRPAGRPRETSNLPAVVRNIPSSQDAGKREQFTRITNSQGSSTSPGIFRSRNEGGADARDGSKPNARVIPVPQNSPRENSSAPQARSIEIPRGQESRGSSGENNTRGSEGSSRQGSGQTTTPSNQQNAPRNERSVPEQKAVPRNESGSSPRSEFQQQNSESAARPGIGRWSESNPGGTRYGGRIQVITPSQSGNRTGGVQVYTLPGSGSGSRWSGDSQPQSMQRSPEPQSVPNESVAPPSETRGRSGSSSSGPNPGTMRSEPARSQESGHTIERGSGNRSSSSPAPSPSERSVPDRDSSKDNRRGR
jgi:hypothetical protein